MDLPTYKDVLDEQSKDFGPPIRPHYCNLHNWSETTSGRTHADPFSLVESTRPLFTTRRYTRAFDFGWRFCEHIRTLGPDWRVDAYTYFLSQPVVHHVEAPWQLWATDEVDRQCPVMVADDWCPDCRLGWRQIHVLKSPVAIVTSVVVVRHRDPRWLLRTDFRRLLNSSMPQMDRCVVMERNIQTMDAAKVADITVLLMFEKQQGGWREVTNQKDSPRRKPSTSRTRVWSYLKRLARRLGDILREGQVKDKSDGLDVT